MDTATLKALSKPVAWDPDVLVQAGVPAEQVRVMLASGPRALPEQARTSLTGPGRTDPTTRYVWGPDVPFLLGLDAKGTSPAPAAPAAPVAKVAKPVRKPKSKVTYWPRQQVRLLDGTLHVRNVEQRGETIWEGTTATRIGLVNLSGTRAVVQAVTNDATRETTTLTWTEVPDGDE